MKGGHNMKYNKDEILKFFEEAGYDNVEIVGNRLLFTTGEDIYYFSIQDAIIFMKNSPLRRCSFCQYFLYYLPRNNK